jgi:DNA-binding transcriptional ArsR family regulator
MEAGMNLELQKSLQMSSPPGGIDGYMLVLLLIMLAAGLLGGAVNYYLSDQTEDASCRGWIKYLTQGVFSALTVPLVLNMLSSNLMDAGRTHPISFFIFSGFCLVYVLLSRPFFEAAIVRILASCKGADRAFSGRAPAPSPGAAAPGAAFRPDEANETNESAAGDPNPPSAPPNAQPSVPLPPAKPENLIESLTLNDIAIVRALSEESFICGNLSGLTEKTGLSRDFISARLAVLKNQGIIEARINDKNALYWHVSPRNRQILDEILSNQG